jgi:hypothetical protein
VKGFRRYRGWGVQDVGERWVEYLSRWAIYLVPFDIVEGRALVGGILDRGVGFGELCLGPSTLLLALRRLAANI